MPAMAIATFRTILEPIAPGQNPIRAAAKIGIQIKALSIN
jgi:hypothetical protein